MEKRFTDYPCGDCIMEFVCPHAYSDVSCSADCSNNDSSDNQGGESK